LGLAVLLLSRASVLPMEEFMRKLEAALKQGLSSKTFFVNRYIKIYKEFVFEETFRTSPQKATIPKPSENQPIIFSAHEQLKWISAPGPGYNKNESLIAVKHRYENCIVPIQVTLKRLRSLESFKKTVQDLKNEGFLDWHILNAIAMVAINYRINKLINQAREVTRTREMLIEFMNKSDEDMEPIPLTELSTDNIRSAININMISSLKGLGFEYRQSSIDINAVSKFLGERFKYWTDDIEHKIPELL
jgi:hypothetical protein